VKIRGHRIELGEIESVLASHPAVEQTIVIVTETTPGDKRLAAYLVFKPESAGDTLISLRSHLKQKLPEYMIPAFLMPLIAMPLTANGKVDRRRLPVPEGVASSESYLAPRTSTESRLVQIWQDVLGVAQVGITDNFFELGGHSLLAMQLASRMLDAFHLRVPLHVIFSHPTVQECAAAIDARKNRGKAEATAA
jgi:acyl carrier protein